MDPWIFAEIWWKDAKVVGSEPFNAGRFGLCCFFGAIVAGELLYLLINMAQHGRQFAFFNYLIPVLGCLIVQFITLAIAMWLAYVPLLEYYLVCITPISAPVIFAQVVTRLPSISCWGLACSLLFGYLWPWQK